VAASTPQPGSSAAASPVPAPGTSGAAGEPAAVSMATAGATVMKKAADNTMVAERAAADKRAADVAAEKKVVDDAMATERDTVEAASRDVAESSPAPAARAKRITVSGDSTPPAKGRFRGSWMPRYAMGRCICLFFIYVYFVSVIPLF
jgi:histone H3/H4